MNCTDMQRYMGKIVFAGKFVNFHMPVNTLQLDMRLCIRKCVSNLCEASSSLTSRIL